MASQPTDLSMTLELWRLRDNCTFLLEKLTNGSFPEDQFLNLCRPHVKIEFGKIVLAIVLSLLLLGTAGGNILVIIAILIVKKLRSPTNLLIVNLAVTDFLVSILVLPFAIAYQLYGHWPFNQAICNLYLISDVLLCTLSILSLCTISIDRYLAITKPFQYAAKRTPKRMVIMILISWILSAAISIPPVFGWEPKKRPFNCDYNEELSYQLYATMTAFYIPLLVMLVLYGKILLLAKQMASQDAQSNRKGSTDTQTRTSSIPESTECNQCPRKEDYTNSHFYPENRDSWDGTGVDSKPRQSVVSFKPPPVVLRKNRASATRGKIPGVKMFSKRSQSNVESSKRLFEYTGSAWRGSSCSGVRSPLVRLRRNRRRQTSDSGKGETNKAVTTLGVIMGCFTVCWLPFFVCQVGRFSLFISSRLHI